MQNEQTLEQMIKEYEDSMPPEIMTLIKSFDYKKEIRMIASQNQLMIDVGADIEKSIYLMILGAIKVEDLYSRLTDDHEMPADKAQKIIQEIETQIFNPLHKKLIELEKEDEKKISENPSRDDILAEIENEPKDIVQPIINQPNIVAPKSVDDKGVTKPFTIASTKVMDVQEPMLTTGKMAEVVKPTVNPEIKPVVEQSPSSTPPVKAYVADPYREPIE